MQYYFQLQFKRAIRFAMHVGLHPVLSAVLLLAGFLLLSHVVFYKLTLASYFYSAVAVYATLANATPERMALLSMIFTPKSKRLVKLVESTLISIPFIGFLCFKTAFLEAGVVFVLSLLLSFFERKRVNGIVIPTPFGRHPFVFIIGFRKNWLLFVMTGIVIIISIFVKNANLGLVILGINIFIPVVFYGVPEDPYYVWVHSSVPSSFLNIKLKLGLLNLLALNTPFALLLIVFFPMQWWIVLILLFLGTMTIALSILSKYAYFPKMPELFQAILVFGSIIFPPLGIALIPVLYIKAAQNLKRMLC